ncbi:LysR family transcriptional regulator [uncultured Dialister sp.]|uniref:LysR family transcriptional regulator n=1 Tax=uncultured Dialister sp. TaxID=278064 RepID=UPI00265E6798|nr:LysR family transcriptional regulator [uncultured Dialister sp.]
MDYRHLKYFMEVAQQKSFSKAARNLHISQSAISRMIKSLEEELGVTLFIRNAKTVEITAPGTIFYNYAKRCLFVFEHLKSDFENEFKLKQDTIEIGLPPITDAHVFAKLLGEFKRTYPQIAIKLYEHGSKVIESSVQEGIIDVGIICTIPNKDFESFFLSEDEMCVVMPKGYPLEENKEVPMKLLADYPLVLYRDDFNLHDDILTNCKKIGFSPRVVFETSQWELMLQTVASGLGVAILPSRLCPRNSKTSRVVTRVMTEPRMTHNLYAIWKKGRFLSRAARLWIEFTKDHLALLNENKKLDDEMKL